MPHSLNTATGIPLPHPTVVPGQADLDVAAIRRAGVDRHEARDVAEIRRLWKARTGEEPDTRMDTRIRYLVQNVADTNEGRFELMASSILGETDDTRFKPSDIRRTRGRQQLAPLVLDSRDEGLPRDEQWHYKYDSLVNLYASSTIPKGPALNALKRLFQTTGFSEKDAEKQALDAIDHIIPTGEGTADPVEPWIPRVVSPEHFEPSPTGETYSQTWIDRPSLVAQEDIYGPGQQAVAGGGYDRPRFAFERYLQEQDFGGRGIDVLAPSAQEQLRGEFPNRLSQFAIFGGGTPPPEGVPWRVDPITGEAGFKAFLGQDVPTREALAERLNFLQDLRGEEVALLSGMENRDDPGAGLSEGELEMLHGYFFNPQDPATSEQRLFRAGLQPALVGMRSDYLSEAFEKGAAIGFERWRSHNPTKTFLDYAQETGLF
jgi:hypothetical protein